MNQTRNKIRQSRRELPADLDSALPGLASVPLHPLVYCR